MGYQRTHFMLAIKTTMAFLASTLIPFLTFFFISQEANSSTWLMIYCSLFSVVLVFSVLKWYYNSYQVSAEQLKVKSGWLNKDFTVYPVESIQGINFTSNFIYRCLGIVHLKMETAGVAGGSSVDIIVTQKEAERIQELIYPEGKETAKSEQKNKIILFDELLVMSATSTGILIGLPAIYSLFVQLQEIFPRHMEKVLDNKVLKSYRVLSEGISLINIGWFALLILLLLGVAWFLGTIHLIFKYHGFTLVRLEDKIHIEHGFFVTKRVTIPIQRIQALKVTEGLFRQPFGLAVVKVVSIGYAEEKGGEAILLPLIRKKEVRQFLRDFVPEFTFEENLITAPIQSLKYYLIREAFLFASFVFVLWAMFDYGYLFAWFFPFAISLAILKYKDAGILQTDRILYLRRRILSRETILIVNKSIQSLDINQHVLHKKECLSHYEVSIASEHQSKSFVVNDLPVSLYKELKEWMFLSQGQKFY